MYFWCCDPSESHYLGGAGEKLTRFESRLLLLIGIAHHGEQPSPRRPRAPTG
jgi:hypothetical protein